MGQDEETAQLALAEMAFQQSNWAVAREVMHRLACAVPQNKQYRAQLSYARARELLAAGDRVRAREELERALRLVPDHADAAAALSATRTTLSRLFRR